MKRIIIVMIALLLVVLGTVYPSDKIEATGKTMYVNAKSDIILRDKPAKDAKQLSTVKNKTAVTVLGTTKEWSHIQVGKQKGYVYSSALSAKNPNKKEAPVVTGGLYPKVGLELVYIPDILGNVKSKYYTLGEDKPQYASDKTFSSNVGLYSNVDDSYADISIVDVVRKGSTAKELWIGTGTVPWYIYMYPMKEGTYTYGWSVNIGEERELDKIFVESTSKTITVKAGTFHNVVILKHPNNYRHYFVKGVGLIKSTDGKGNIIAELISIK